MKRNEITPGVVYAEHQSYGQPHPVVFLDTRLYCLRPGRRYDRTRTLASPRSTRPQHGTYGSDSVGYLTVNITGWNQQVPWEKRLEALRALDVKAEVQRWLDNQEPSQPGLMVALVYSLNKIRGEYDAELAAYIERKEAERKEKDEVAAARTADRNRAQFAAEELSELAGVRATAEERYGVYHVQLSTEDAEKLVRLLKGDGKA